jgi:multicomponent Na+:H+ antiporter subunit E
MIAILNVSLRLAIWFLLTADGSPANILIGVLVALLLPLGYTGPGSLGDWLRALGEALAAIPRAYMEAFLLIFRPHVQEEVSREKVKPQRTPGLVFLDIFLITFTPRTLVLKYHKDGWYEVHRLKRRRQA